VKKYSGGYNIFIVTKENFELLATLAKGDFSLPLTIYKFIIIIEKES
jgi:hypothetical protein